MMALITCMDKRNWKISSVHRQAGVESAQLSYFSPHGEEGYPGNVELLLTYSLTPDNKFIIESEVRTDRTTPINLTHHSYFNLAGEGNGDILNHKLNIYADKVFDVDNDMTPLPYLKEVAGKGSDFRRSKVLAEAAPELFQNHGDLYWLGHSSENQLKLAAKLYEPNSGRILTVSTTDSCLQLYTGAHFDGSLKGKSNQSYEKYAGLCLECESYPGAIERGDFGSILVQPHKPIYHKTVYAFSTDQLE